MSDGEREYFERREEENILESPKYGLQRYFLRFPEFWETIDDFRGIALFLLFAWTIALGGAGAELLTDMIITNYE